MRRQRLRQINDSVPSRRIADEEERTVKFERVPDQHGIGVQSLGSAQSIEEKGDSDIKGDGRSLEQFRTNPAHSGFKKLKLVGGHADGLSQPRQVHSAHLAAKAYSLSNMHVDGIGGSSHVTNSGELKLLPTCPRQPVPFGQLLVLVYWLSNS